MKKIENVNLNSHHLTSLILTIGSQDMTTQVKP